MRTLFLISIPLLIIAGVFFIAYDDMVFCLPQAQGCSINWEATGSVLSSIALLVAGGAAVYGIDKWKHEQLSNRRQEAALNMLQLVHSARGKIARSVLWGAIKPHKNLLDQQGMEEGFGGDQHTYSWWSVHYRSATVFLQNMSDNEEFWSEYEAVASKSEVILGEQAGVEMQRISELKILLAGRAEIIRRYFWNRATGDGHWDIEEFDNLSEYFPYNATAGDDGWPEEDLSKKVHPDIESELENVCMRCKELAKTVFRKSLI